MAPSHRPGLTMVQFIGATGLMVTLTACGGDGNGNTGAAPPPPPVTAPATPTPPPPPPPTPPPPPPPTSTAGNIMDFAAAMAPGWNLGNSLESLADQGKAPYQSSQETNFGNARVTPEMLQAVADAGFKSVRIPVAWLQYADADDNISTAWLDRVEQVVKYARDAGLTAIINIHYDQGWLVPTYAEQDRADQRLRKFWTQIATRFRDYGPQVVFAGTNEVMVRNEYGPPTAENCKVQNGFNSIFVDAVRATGGNNATRYLIVQGYNTNIDYTVSCNATLPQDSASNSLMMEVHYYDPYDFTLNADSDKWQWGASATDQSKVVAGANEAHVDAEFQKMHDSFVDRGIPVILGEYSAISKFAYDPDGTYRTAWDKYVAHSAFAHGMIPFYWDNGGTGNHTSGLFNRATAKPVYPTTISAVVAAGSGK